jgi:alanine racemase
VNSRPTWAEINLSAVAFNMQQMQQVVGERVKVLAVVKANAYGHGLVPVAQTLRDNGAWGFGVATVDEGIALREAGVDAPVLILSATLSEEATAIVNDDLTPAVASVAVAETLNAAAERARKTLNVHVKVDVGMGRLGVWHEEAVEFINCLMTLSHLRLQGVFTHFPCADEENLAVTLHQIHLFHQLRTRLLERWNVPLFHAANSAAALRLRESHFNLIRPGLALYGVPPCPFIPHLQPALSLKTRIAFLKNVPAGHSLSYSGTYVTPKPTTIATLPIGYADGYPRSLSNRGIALVRGQRCPVVGRVTMDATLIDVGAVKDAALGDEVVLFGEALPVEEIAALAGTIPYEILCGIGQRVPRVY